MHVGNQMVSGTTLQRNIVVTRTVIVEVKYINSKNVVIHSENCKVEIPLDITAQQLSKKICRMTGIYEASKKRGFTDCSTEMFYVDYIEPGQPKKAPFVLRTDDQLSMFFKSESKSILLRVIQRIVQFEKGSVNILMEKDEKSCEVELSSTSTQSSASPNSKSSNDGVSKESTRTVIPSHSRKRQKVTRSQDPKRLSEIGRLKELLLKPDGRLSEDGKSIKCLLCGKSPKVDKCKRSVEGHIKHFNRVHSCTTKTNI